MPLESGQIHLEAMEPRFAKRPNFMIDFDPRGDPLAGAARGNIVRRRTVGLAYYDSRRNGAGPTSTRKVDTAVRPDFPNRMVLGTPISAPT
jgi:hypothetical protein